VRTLIALTGIALTAGCVTEMGQPEDGLDDSDGKSDGADGCHDLKSGPFTPVALGHIFDGSEDFALDGRGAMVARRGNVVVRADGTGHVTSTIASLTGQTLGLRYHPNGNLIGAMVGAGKLVKVAPHGRVTDLVTGLNGPNGVYVDRDGNVWFTEGGGNRVTRLAPDGQRRTFASGSGAEGANGVVVNEATKRLYYTEYDKAHVHMVDLTAQNPSTVLVAQIAGAGLDGLVLDACGNVYTLDQKRSRLYRVRIAANGKAAAEPELLATFPVNVANAQFGSGPGFDSKKLYVVGNPGSVFALDLGVAGARVPTPAEPIECEHTFEMPGTGGEQMVELRGDFRFNAWAAGEPMTFDAATGTWSTTVALPSDTAIEYKFHFFVNGAEKWIFDPANPNTQNGNSVVRVSCAPPN